MGDILFLLTASDRHLYVAERAQSYVRSQSQLQLRQCVVDDSAALAAPDGVQCVVVNITASPQSAKVAQIAAEWANTHGLLLYGFQSKYASDASPTVAPWSSVLDGVLDEKNMSHSFAALETHLRVSSPPATRAARRLMNPQARRAHFLTHTQCIAWRAPVSWRVRFYSCRCL